MKKLLTLLSLAILVSIAAPTFLKSNETKAQLVYTLSPTAAKDTTANTDTAFVYISTGLGSTTTAVADNISRSATASVTKLSGTVGGKAYFQGSVDGTNFYSIDSLTLSDQTTNQKTFPMRNANGDLLYKQYRIGFYMTGTQSSIPKVYYLRRSN